MQREDVHQIVDARVMSVDARVASFIESEKENRRVANNLIQRLVSVVAGDKEFNQTGLVQRVESVEKDVKEFQTIKTEVITSVRTVLFLGGALITGINVLIQLYRG